MVDPSVALLRDLVSIDSVNPSLVSNGAGEREIGEFIYQHMRAAGMDVEIQESSPGRPNVVGVLQGRSAGKTLMFWATATRSAWKEWRGRSNRWRKTAGFMEGALRT